MISVLINVRHALLGSTLKVVTAVSVFSVQRIRYVSVITILLALTLVIGEPIHLVLLQLNVFILQISVWEESFVRLGILASFAKNAIITKVMRVARSHLLVSAVVRMQVYYLYQY
jgi:hypothetical protein